MEQLIPAQYYSLIFFHVLLIVTLLVLAQGDKDLEDSSNLKSKKSMGLFLLFFATILIGVRPISLFFGDMVIYDREFQNYVNGASPIYTKDVLFEFLKYTFSQVTTSRVFFFFCSILYVIPLYFASKKLFKDYWFYGFFILIISFSFWSYGTNGIRNGIASSLFLYGLSKNKKWLILTILFLSTFIHKSMTLPLAAYIFTLFYNKTKSYMYFWFLAIPLSLVMGGFFQALFLKLGIIEEKSIITYLGEFNQANEGVELKVGFRWDFILYSASGVFAGWYFIFKKKFEDVLYSQLFNIYLITNGFWILIIRANFSNRFAYLSWFMMGLIIIYPLLKNKLFVNQHKVINIIILITFAFTYLMNVILE